MKLKFNQLSKRNSNKRKSKNKDPLLLNKIKSEDPNLQIPNLKVSKQ
jgi:hypothetical protein